MTALSAPRPPFRRAPLRGAGTMLAALLALAVPAAAHGKAEGPSARAQKRLGLEIKSLRLTATGYMVDVRYRVRDPRRAKSFLEQKSKDLYLVDEATGMRLAVPNTPKLGTLRQRVRNGDVHTDRDYFVLFANPARHLRQGDKVTLVAGNTRIPDLRVE